MYQRLNFSQAKLRLGMIFCASLLLNACGDEPNVIHEEQAVEVTGKWIVEPDTSSMFDPQTSGLSYSDSGLFTVSDGSADASQIQLLHKLDPDSAEIVKRLGPITLDSSLVNSCFASYLSERPDYEALVAWPKQENTWLIATEDATRAGNYTEACKAQYSDTGSTEFPSLIVRVELIDDDLIITGIRALQFPKTAKLGDFPNDGIEGMTIAKDGTVYIGVEKDEQKKPRIFSFQLNDELFASDEFLPVVDANLNLPVSDKQAEQSNHPINGMDIYYPQNSETGFLILAARNDDQLWIVDTQKKRPTKIIDMVFKSPCGLSEDKGQAYQIANAAMEGIAVRDDRLYIINDPWKKVYKDNTKETLCPQDKTLYERYSPLLFEMPIPSCFTQGRCD